MPSALWIPGRDRKVLDSVARRIEYQASHSPDDGDPDLPRDPWEPRYRIDQRWVEFECGCRAERKRPLDYQAMPGDAIIFAGLPEQAVYDEVCHRHGPGMNKYVRFTGAVTFDQWKLHRRHLLMGRK